MKIFEKRQLRLKKLNEIETGITATIQNITPSNISQKVSTAGRDDSNVKAGLINGTDIDGNNANNAEITVSKNQVQQNPSSVISMAKNMKVSNGNTMPNIVVTGINQSDATTTLESKVYTKKSINEKRLANLRKKSVPFSKKEITDLLKHKG